MSTLIPAEYLQPLIVYGRHTIYKSQRDHIESLLLRSKNRFLVILKTPASFHKNYPTHYILSTVDYYFSRVFAGKTRHTGGTLQNCGFHTPELGYAEDS